jgi:hypothetical protein
MNCIACCLDSAPSSIEAAMCCFPFAGWRLHVNCLAFRCKGRSHVSLGSFPRGQGWSLLFQRSQSRLAGDLKITLNFCLLALFCVFYAMRERRGWWGREPNECGVVLYGKRVSDEEKEVEERKDCQMGQEMAMVVDLLEGQLWPLWAAANDRAPLFVPEPCFYFI